MSDHASLWMTDAPQIASDPFPADDRVHDLVVVGAGITGLTAATMFARRGLDVVVLEAREPGAVTTGHTTAKVTQLQGTMLQRIRGRATASTLAAHVESQSAAFEWLAGFAAVNGVPFERRDAITYAATAEGVAQVEAEHRLARAHGLPTELIGDAGLPFPTHGAVRLADQGQIEPLQLVAALARELRDAGGTLTGDARVTGVEAGRLAEFATVRVGDRMLRARRVVLATGHVILDRGLYFAKLAAKRSYAQAWRVDEDHLPTGMYLGVEQPTRSVREARGLLLTGGNSHGVGRAASEQAQADDLAAWTRENWPGAEPVAEWSAQDYLTPHGVPFVGWLPRGGGKVYLASGFSKWGMTNGVATALTLVGDILGDSAGWQRTLHRRVTLPAAFAVGLGENLAVARWYATSWARALTHPVPERTLEGHGEVGRRGLVPTAVSTVAGATNEVCAVCPHLGAVVQWNDYERSWDCPAHGSRFAPDGTLLEGPATRGLRPAPTP
ncbi:MAG TPA: FAD-dependent oxidoreductase [Pseudolysinimonas sp.]|jgi:glycine/D-amino acid oxidase-like deaminating enzyme|nr:FAD-dependent oxidoreductase [Pseudolysinimonas sp.]